MSGVRANWIGSCADRLLLSSPSVRTARKTCMVRLMVIAFRDKRGGKNEGVSVPGVNKRTSPKKGRTSSTESTSILQVYIYYRLCGAIAKRKRTPGGMSL